jgi:predicted nucleotidyltransferase
MQQPIIQKIVDLIVPLVDPDRIILFGSYARGDFSEHSDVDLLVLKRGLENVGEIEDKIYYSFYENKIRVDVDVIAMDYDRYFDVLDDFGYIYRNINKEGIVLYESI